MVPTLSAESIEKNFDTCDNKPGGKFNSKFIFIKDCIKCDKIFDIHMDNNKFTLKETELENASQEYSCFKNQEILEV